MGSTAEEGGLIFGAAPPLPSIGLLSSKPHMPSNSLRAGEFVASFLRHWRLVTAFALVGTVMAVLVVTSLPRRYTATALIEIAGHKDLLVGVQTISGATIADPGLVETAARELRSRGIAGDVVDNLNLVSDPTFTAQPWYSHLLQGAISDIRDWQPPAWLVPYWILQKDNQPTTDSWLRRSMVVDAFLDRLRVDSDDRSYVISISFSASEPEKAAEITNAIIADYFDGQLAARVDATTQANRWLNDHLAKAAEVMHETSLDVQRFRDDNNLLTNEGGALATAQLQDIFKRVVDAQTQVAAADAQMHEAERLSATLHTGSGVDANRSGPATDAYVNPVLSSPLIQRLREQQAEVTRRQAQLRAAYSNASPLLDRVKAEGASIQQQIDDETGRIVAGIANNAREAKDRLNLAMDAFNEMRNHVRALNKAEGRLVELQQKANAGRAVYETTLAKVLDTSNTNGYPSQDGRVVSKAEPPIRPSFPATRIFVGVGFLLSSLAGLSLSVAFDRRRKGFASSVEIEDVLGLPTAGMVPAVDAPLPLVSDCTPRRISPACSEAVSGIWPMLRLKTDALPQALMITSAIAGEGKSVLVVALAQSLADLGWRVAVVDLDLRRPGASKSLGLTGKNGLPSVLDGTMSVADCLVWMPGGFAVLPSGSRQNNPRKLLHSNRLKDVIGELKQTFDVVLVDTPPTLAVSDAVVTAHIVDCVLFVVRWSQTPRSAVISSLKQLQAVGASIAGVVLTQVNLRQHRSLGFGDSASFYPEHRRYYEG